MADYGPLPDALSAIEWQHNMYTADQMRAYAAQAADAERERCALRLQGLMAPPSDTPWWGGWNAALKKAADLFKA